MQQEAQSEAKAEALETDEPFKPNSRFWLIFAGLALAALVSALDTAVIATALPTVEHDLNAGNKTIWVINIYFLTTAAIQPLSGQIADLFGRRWPVLVSVLLFLLGSGLCGGASSIDMLIVGRAVQGLGNGGITTYVDMIISDLVPLKYRSKFMGMIFAIVILGTSFGPFVGGSLAQHRSWRYIFWINFPVVGPAFAILLFSLKVSYRRDKTWQQCLLSIDYVGNFLAIGSTVAITWALTYGSTGVAWSSAQLVVPLTLGLAAIPVFALYEISGFCRSPVIPASLFRNRTSAAGFVATFFSMILVFSVNYFYPFFFQAVLRSTPTRTGVQMLPYTLVFPVSVVLSGALLSRFERYKIMHLCSFALSTIALGLSSLLGSTSSDAAWILLLIFLALTFGVPMATLLPAVQSGLSDSETALSAATWAYIRSLGSIWGVTIPIATLNGRFGHFAHLIADPSVRMQLSGGRAYQSASKNLYDSLAEPSRGEVLQVYVEALRWVWYVSVIFGGLTVLAVSFEKENKLRTTNVTDFGLETSEKDRDESKNIMQRKSVHITEVARSGA